MRLTKLGILTVAILLTAVDLASAVSVYTETFNSDAANWRQNVSATSVVYNASGGPDSTAYVSSDFAFASAFSPQVAVLRGHDAFNASNDAFVGNWLAADITQLSAYVRHNVPQPMSFFVRLAKSANSPAVSFSFPTPVPTGTWTKLDFDISYSNPLRTNESMDTSQTFYDDVLSNIGNVQIGILVPQTLVNGTTTSAVYRYDLDNIGIVPEPSSFLLSLGGIAALGCVRRRKR